MNRIIQKPNQGVTSGRRASEVNEVRVQLAENQRSSAVASAGPEVHLGDSDRPRVVLVAGPGEGKQRARVDQRPHYDEARRLE